MAWRQGILQHYRLEDASFLMQKPHLSMFYHEQVDTLTPKQLEMKVFFSLMGFAGLRMGEVEQLCKQVIIIKK
jgi:hypothetical protein